MKYSHVHFKVENLIEAVRWFESAWELRPSFRNEKMAVIPVGELSFILDAADENSRATIAFTSDDCERDFRRATERGAEVISPPAQTPWGVIAAYLQGPGELTVEIEQPLPQANQ